jgi:hypothetical protein
VKKIFITILFSTPVFAKPVFILWKKLKTVFNVLQLVFLVWGKIFATSALWIDIYKMEVVSAK